MVGQYLEEAGIRDKVNLILGDAMTEIPKLEGTFDLVYLDADKENYVKYFELIIDLVNPGGYILADNVL